MTVNIRVFLAMMLVAMGSMIYTDDNPKRNTPAVETKRDTTKKTDNTVVTDTTKEVNTKKSPTIDKDIRTTTGIDSVVLNGQTDLYINTVQAMQESKEGIQMEARLLEKRQDLTNEIRTLEQELNRMSTEYKNKESAMSPAARASAEKEIIKKRSELETAMKNAENDLKYEFQRCMEEFSADLEKAAIKYAKANNIHSIADAITGKVIYVNPDIMVTDAIVRIMDDDYMTHKKAAALPATAAAA